MRSQGPTARQIAYGDKLGIDVRGCTSVAEASKAIEIAQVKYRVKIATEKGIMPGVWVRYALGSRLGKVRYVKSIADGLVVGVDWVRPKKFFSRCGPNMLTLANDPESDPFNIDGLPRSEIWMATYECPEGHTFDKAVPHKNLGLVGTTPCITHPNQVARLHSSRPLR